MPASKALREIIFVEDLNNQLNVEDSTWKNYGVAEMDAHEILSFGATPLLIRIIKRYVLEDSLFRKELSRVLEIGAGTCQGSYLIKQRKGDDCLVISTDASSTTLLAGKKLSKIFANDVDDFVCCDAASLPFRDLTFGLVFGCAVLHHLKNPAIACSEVKRVLVSGGDYIGMEGAVSRRVRQVVRVMTGVHYRETREGVREDMYDFDSWRDLFASIGMFVRITPLIFPSAYRELVGAKIVPRAYRPRYRLRYPYERILSSLPSNLVRSATKNLLPVSVLIRAAKKGWQ